MALNWNLAVEKNLEALRRILTMLVGLVGMTAPDASDCREKTLPRHLHRYVLRLLRPAESATRRLIFIAARGLVVSIRASQPRSSRAARNNGTVFGRMAIPEAAQNTISHRTDKRCSTPSLSLLDPLKRFGSRRRHAKRGPEQSLAGDPIVSRCLHPEPSVSPPDSSRDAGSIHRRLEAIRRVLDDLPGEARRMALWTARRDARLAWEQIESGCIEQAHGNDGISPLGAFAPATVRPDMSSVSGCAPGERPIPTPAPEISGETVGGTGGRNGDGASSEEPGVEPQRLVSYRARGRLGRGTSAQRPRDPRRRLDRLSPILPRPRSGWRRQFGYDVHEVSNDLDGLAIWTSERRDSS